MQGKKEYQEKFFVSLSFNNSSFNFEIKNDITDFEVAAYKSVEISLLPIFDEDYTQSKVRVIIG